MPNPYEATDIQFGSEVRDPLAELWSRLAELGATPDEVTAIRENWTDYDEDWTPADAAAFRIASDPQLSSMLAEVRTEHFEHTHTEVEEEDLRSEAADGQAREDAAGRMGGTVASLLEWVHSDGELAQARAGAVYDLEAEGQQRTTLLTPLRELLGDEAFEAEDDGMQTHPGTGEVMTEVDHLDADTAGD